MPVYTTAKAAHPAGVADKHTQAIAAAEAAAAVLQQDGNALRAAAKQMASDRMAQVTVVVVDGPVETIEEKKQGVDINVTAVETYIG